jgi:hypothetical protein
VDFWAAFSGGVEEWKLQDGLQGKMTLEEYQEVKKEALLERKEVVETGRKARMDSPLARFSQEKMVARDEQDEQEDV